MIGTLNFRVGNFDALTAGIADSLKDSIDDIVADSVETQVGPIVDSAVTAAVNKQVPAIIADELTPKMTEINQKIASVPTTEVIEGMIEDAISGIEPSVDPEAVQQIVDERIAANEAADRDAGEYDDTKVYADLEHFPGKAGNLAEEPRADVLYIDQATGTQYTWDATANDYTPLFDSISTESIMSLINGNNG